MNEIRSALDAPRIATRDAVPRASIACQQAVPHEVQREVVPASRERRRDERHRQPRIAMPAAIPVSTNTAVPGSGTELNVTTSSYVRRSHPRISPGFSCDKRGNA